MRNKSNPYDYGNAIVAHMRINCHMEQLNHIMPMKGYNKKKSLLMYNYLTELESAVDNKIRNKESIPDGLYDNLESIFGSRIYDYLSINFNYKVGRALRLSIDTPSDYPILKGMDDLIIIAPFFLNRGESVYDKLIFNQKYL